jgi:hypothetical protein
MRDFKYLLSKVKHFENKLWKMKFAMREIFFTVHEKVSIQDAQSSFGPGQIGALHYPDYFSRKFRSSLEAQAQGGMHRLGSQEDGSPIHEISWI